MAPAPTTQMRMDVPSDAVDMLGVLRDECLTLVCSEVSDDVLADLDELTLTPQGGGLVGEVGDDVLADFDEGGVLFRVIQPSRRTGRSPAADMKVDE